MNGLSGRWKYGLALTLLTVAMWGVLPIALKAMLRSMDAYSVTWYRLLVATLLLGFWLAAHRRLPRLSLLSRQGLGLLAAAAFGLCGNYLLYLLGLNLVSPGTAQIVIQTAPLFLMAGGLILFGESFRPRQWIGLVVLLSGIALFFNERLGDLLRPGNYAVGVGLVIGAAVVWAIYALAQKKLLSDMSSSQIMWCIYATGTLVFLPTAAPGSLLGLSGAGLALLAFCSVNTLVAYGAFAEALAHWEATRVSAVLSITPLATLLCMELVTIVAPEFLAPESLNVLSWIGAVLVVTGSTMIALTGNRGRRPH